MNWGKLASRVGVGIATGGTSEALGYKGGTEFGRPEVANLPIVGNAYDKVTGQGAYAPVDTAQLQADNEKTRALRDLFAQQYGATGPTVAPTMGAAAIDTTQSDQARGIQTGALGTIDRGLAIEGAGAGVQGVGLGAQNEGIAAQRSALDVQRGAVDTQREGVGVQRQALGIQQGAADRFNDVLDGKTPSVAEMTGRRLAGEAAANAVGNAAGATGGSRTAALRTAINAAGAIGASSAASAATGRAAEQDTARQGLLGAGTAISGTGSQITGAGSQIAGTGTGIAGTGQGITAGGQGISATGRGLSATGADIVNGGATQAGVGTAVRGQDITVAGHQADLTQGASTSNLGAAVNNRAQDITQENNRGTLALGGTTAATNADTNQITQIRQNNADQRKNDNELFDTAGDIAVASDERVKNDVRTAAPSQVSQLFRSFVGSSVDDDDPYVTQPTQPSTARSLARTAAHQRIGPDPIASDERVKTGKAPGGMAARDLFDDVVPKTFRYDGEKLAAGGLKKPATEDDEHLGVMAQDVERSGKLGRGIVKSKGGVKTLDMPMAVSALMAAVADIENRIGKGSRARA